MQQLWCVLTWFRLIKIHKSVRENVKPSHLLSECQWRNSLEFLFACKRKRLSGEWWPIDLSPCLREPKFCSDRIFIVCSDQALFLTKTYCFVGLKHNRLFTVNLNINSWSVGELLNQDQNLIYTGHHHIYLSYHHQSLMNTWSSRYDLY